MDIKYRNERKTLVQKIRNFEKIVAMHRRHYYSGIPLICDASYDMMVNNLNRLIYRLNTPGRNF